MWISNVFFGTAVGRNVGGLRLLQLLCFESSSVHISWCTDVMKLSWKMCVCLCSCVCQDQSASICWSIFLQVVLGVLHNPRLGMIRDDETWCNLALRPHSPSRQIDGPRLLVHSSVTRLVHRSVQSVLADLSAARLSHVNNEYHFFLVQLFSPDEGNQP